MTRHAEGRAMDEPDPHLFEKEADEIEIALNPPAVRCEAPD